MRRLAALAALLVLASGCGGSGGDKSADTTGSSNGSGPNPIAQAAASTSQAGGLKIDFEIAGPGVHGGGRGAFDTGSTGKGRLAMSFQTNGQATTMDTIVAGSTLYMRSPVFAQLLPAGKEWVRLDLAKLASAEGVDLGSLVDSNPSPNSALAYLNGANGPVRVVGHSKVRGADTTHYRTTIDLEQAARKAKGSQKRSIRRVINVAGVRKLPVDVWVGDDGYVRKVIYSQHSSRNQEAKITMELYDFGSTVTTGAPPASSVVDFQQLITPQGG
jgi:hypothetical protein